jgi:FAD/FMN-containing dehydrogenase
MNRSRLKAQEVIHTNLQKARLTGHSVSEGGIVLDLSDMRKIEIDAGLRTAWAQTGLTAGQFTTAAAAHGLATGFGDMESD